MDYSFYNIATAALAAAKTIYNDMFPQEVEFVVEIEEMDSDDESWLDAMDVLVSVTDELVESKAFYDIV